MTQHLEQHLEQYVVETPAGEIFKVFAENAYDAEKQVLEKINFKNTLVHSTTTASYEKFDAPGYMH